MQGLAAISDLRQSFRAHGLDTSVNARNVATDSFHISFDTSHPGGEVIAGMGCVNRHQPLVAAHLRRVVVPYWAQAGQVHLALLTCYPLWQGNVHGVSLWGALPRPSNTSWTMLIPSIRIMPITL